MDTKEARQLQLLSVSAVELHLCCAAAQAEVVAGRSSAQQQEWEANWQALQAQLRAQQQQQQHHAASRVTQLEGQVQQLADQAALQTALLEQGKVRTSTLGACRLKCPLFM